MLRRVELSLNVGLNPSEVKSPSLTYACSMQLAGRTVDRFEREKLLKFWVCLPG